MQTETRLKRAEILQVVRQIKQEVLAVRRALDRWEERVDSACQYVCALESSLADESQAAVPGLVSVDSPLGARIDSGRRIRKSRKELERLGRVGVERLEFQWLPSRSSAFVQVNDAPAFKLSRTLAHLLEILAQDSTPSDDALVGWKSYTEVADALHEKVDRLFSKHAINQLVSRLRRALVDGGGVNPYLVHSERHHGLRFARRRKEKLRPDETVCDQTNALTPA